MAAQEPRTGGGWEVLDEDFFMYKEDVDLAWRLRRLGWQAWYQPSAVAWHGRTAAAGDPSSLFAVVRSNRAIPHWIKAMSWRNQHLMQLKNDTVAEMVRDFPWLLGREMASLGFMTVTDPRRLSAVLALARLAGSARRKRRWLRATASGRRASPRSHGPPAPAS